MPNEHVFLNKENLICWPGHLCSSKVLHYSAVFHIFYPYLKIAASKIWDVALGHIAISIEL